MYSVEQCEAVNGAISNFSATNKDPKAQIVGEFVSTAGQVFIQPLRSLKASQHNDLILLMK